MSKLDDLYEKYEDEQGRCHCAPIVRYEKAYEHTVSIIEEIVAEILVKLETGQFFRDIRYNWIVIDRKKYVAFFVMKYSRNQENEYCKGIYLLSNGNFRMVPQKRYSDYYCGQEISARHEWLSFEWDKPDYIRHIHMELLFMAKKIGIDIKDNWWTDYLC